jgi:hypothetical protein
MNGIKAPFIQVTKPKMKNNPAIIKIGTKVLFFDGVVDINKFTVRLMKVTTLSNVL